MTIFEHHTKSRHQHLQTNKKEIRKGTHTEYAQQISNK